MFEPPGWLFWVLLLSGTLMAILLAYHEVRMQSVHLARESVDKMIVPLVLAKPKKYLRADHSVALFEVAQRMESIHGHSDFDGLRADAKDGVLVSDLLSRNCTRCGKPRNQERDYIL